MEHICASRMVNAAGLVMVSSRGLHAPHLECTRIPREVRAVYVGTEMRKFPLPVMDMPVRMLGSRTAGYGLGYLAMSVPSTLLQALRGLMHGVENLSVPGLRATSQNILWSTMKVNDACAQPPHIM
jgi:hypothetical protein